MSDEFRMFYSSGDAKGVGVVLGPRARDKVISVRYRYVENRVMVVRLQGKKWTE